MKLVRVRVRNYRSLFTDATSGDFEVSLGDGMNTFVGPNNCGKSNIIRAIALAFREFPFNRSSDMPATKPYAYPSITLTFHSEASTSVEKTLLRYVREYELAVKESDSGRTFADDGEIRLNVKFPGNEQTGATRQEQFLARGAGARSLSEDDDRLKKALRKFHQAVRFAMVPSGMDLDSLLETNFRQILHAVLGESVAADLDQARQYRDDYMTGLRAGVLAPLRTRLTDGVRRLFPEIEDVELEPDVRTIEETLSRVAIDLRDAAVTGLASKGTGVRGGVLVSMLRYLADNTRRSMVLAVEEPESFLHPAAQESLRDDLEGLAHRDDVTLLVTTHSPFLVARQSHGRVLEVTKEPAGRTTLIREEQGDGVLAPLLGGLFRDSAVARVLEDTRRIPDTARAILLVEGITDSQYLALASDLFDQGDLLGDVYVLPSHGTVDGRLVREALMTRAIAGDRIVMALLDNDADGKSAFAQLKTHGFVPGTTLFTYADAFEGKERDFEWEAEDVFAPSLVDYFITDENRTEYLKGTKKRPDGAWHYDLAPEAKPLFARHVQRRGTKADFARWFKLIEHLRHAAGLGDVRTGDEPHSPATRITQLEFERRRDALLDEIRACGGDTAMAGAKSLFGWAGSRTDECFWTSGRGAYAPTIGGNFDSGAPWPFVLTPKARVEIQFQYLRSRKPFTDASLLDEYGRRLHAIDGLSFSHARVGGRPSFPVADLGAKKRANQFIKVMEWFRAQVSDESADDEPSGQ